MNKTVTNTCPYKLFRDGKEMEEFLKHCRGCVRGSLNEWGQPDCPVVDTLVNSITDSEQRWEPDWVILEKGKPVCIVREEVKNETSK